MLKIIDHHKKTRRTTEERLRLKRNLVDMLGGKCVDCGYSTHLAALDFDHMNPSKKKFTIAEGLTYMDSTKVMKEAQTCELRCANCHRVKTHPQAHLEECVA